MRLLTKVFVVLLVGSLLPASAAHAVIKSLNNQKSHTQFFADDANVGINSANDVHTINWSGVLQPSRGGTGASSFSAGSVLFFSGGKIFDNNSAFFWDNTNNRLGIGISTPAYAFDIAGDVRWSGTLQGGNVPWARITNFPAGCPVNQVVQAVGATLTCVPVSTNAGTVTELSQGTGLVLSPNPITATGTIAVDTAVVPRKTVPETVSGGWTFGVGDTTFGSNVNLPGSGIWSASGRVGIGTATPSGPLEISSAGNSVFEVGSEGIVNAPRQRWTVSLWAARACAPRSLEKLLPVVG